MKTVEAYIRSKPDWSAALETLRGVFQEYPFEETIKWGQPVYMAHGRNLVGMSAFKNHFGLWFFEGSLLKDEAGKLENAQEGKTRFMRQWKFTSMEELDLPLLRRYLEETLEQAGTQPAPKKITTKTAPAPVMAALLDQALDADPDLKAAFDSFTPYKQREFSEYVQEAKRESTRLKRLEKIREMILRGEGLNDKYR